VSVKEGEKEFLDAIMEWIEAQTAISLAEDEIGKPENNPSEELRWSSLMQDLLEERSGWSTTHREVLREAVAAYERRGYRRGRLEAFVEFVAWLGERYEQQ
jgi:hypothetical protein